MLLRVTAMQMNAATTVIEQGSLLVALVGLLMLWRKAGALVRLEAGGVFDGARCT